MVLLRQLLSLRPRLRAQSRRHLGVHHHRGSAANCRDDRADLFRRRPLASCDRRHHADGIGGAGDLDGPESMGFEYRATLLVAGVLARPGRPDPAACFYGSVTSSTGRAAKPGFRPVDSSMAPRAMIWCHGIRSDISTWAPPFDRVRLAGTSPSQMPAES